MVTIFFKKDWHQDTYVGFRKKFNVSDDVELTNEQAVSSLVELIKEII